MDYFELTEAAERQGLLPVLSSPAPPVRPSSASGPVQQGQTVLSVKELTGARIFRSSGRWAPWLLFAAYVGVLVAVVAG